MRPDEGIKPQEIGSLDLRSRAATGDRASKTSEGTCGFYRGGCEATGVSCYLGQTTEPVFSLELEL